MILGWRFSRSAGAGLCLLLSLTLLLCGGAMGQGVVAPAAANAAAQAHFRDVGLAAGLTTVPHFAEVKQYVVEMMGGGVALFDCDNDGRLDILTVTDSTVERYLAGGDLMVTLYHQDAAGSGKAAAAVPHFTDRTLSAGLTTRGWGMGVAVADFDGDGLPDIYVTGYGHNVLYRNLGGCKFADVTAKAGVAGGGFSVAAAWADYDRDGRVDLFVSRYMETDVRHLPALGGKGFNYQGLPMEVPRKEGQTDFLFHNLGEGRFEEVGAKAGVDNPDKRLGMGVIWADYDHDGWPDLFVTNDMGPNFLYHNRHDGTFEELGLVSGTALSSEGKSMGNMAGDFADYNHRGALDLLVTRYGYQPVSLFRYEGATGFSDQTFAAHLETGVQPVRWGGGFADFDNDGWPDIFIANGNVSSMIDQLPNDLKFREPLQMFLNGGDGTFREVATAAGLNDGLLQSRRGTAFGDVNNDGRVDVVVYNVGGPPSLFLNDTVNANHSVLLRLIGGGGNRSAIGARVTVTAGKVSQIDEVRGGASYLSSNDLRLHFGLGAAVVVSMVRIEWPDGHVELLRNLPADEIYSIEEGKGVREKVGLSRP